MPEMKVGDRVRYIDEQFRLAEFFVKGGIYTVESSEVIWPEGFYYTNQYGERVSTGKPVRKFSFVEVPGYDWTCDFFFEDVVD